jgi:tetratricopeptide (TPR) repeat protein
MSAPKQNPEFPNFRFADRLTVENQIGKPRELNCSAVPPVVGSLILLSIFPYACASVWAEAVVLTVIFILGAGIALRQNPGANTEVKSLTAPFFALALYSFFQGFVTLFAPDESGKFFGALPFSFDLTASFWSAAKFFALAVFIVIVLSASRRQIEFVIWSLIFTGNFYAVFGIVRFVLQAGFPQLFGWFALPELRPGIGFGTFINQNHFAYLMLMNLGLNIGVCFCGGLEKNIRRILFVFCLITFAAIVLTASRGGILSSFAVVGVLILLPKGRLFASKSDGERQLFQSKFVSFGKKIISAAALITALVGGIVLIGQDRVLERFEEFPEEFQTATTSHGFLRVDVWRATVKMIAEQPFYGVGFGGFRVAVSQYAEISGAVAPREAHNDYLELAAAGGAFAVLCVVWFLYFFGKLLKRRFSESSTPFQDAARIGATGAFAGIAVHNFFDFSLHLIGNQIFLTALLCVAVHRKYANAKDENGESPERFLNANIRQFLYPVLLLCAGVLSVWFGYSRLENSLAKNSLDQFFARDDSAKIPFDADFYETKAFINESSGNRAAAAENLRQAIYYRPKDYRLRLNLARIESSQNQSAAADNNFREAIRLAPHYGEPYFYYGKFLVAVNRKAVGFDNLRRAFQRRPPYFKEVAALAWRETGGDADETIRILSPLETVEKEKLGEFLLDQKAYAAVAALLCRETDASEMTRDRLVRVLLEKKQFVYANQIQRRECDSPNSLENNLVDGDFETGELYEGFGFGWRVADLPETIEIGLDDENKSHGGNSLGFIFNGHSESSQPLLSQTFVVGKNRRYQISFDFRTEKIVTGGVPSVQLILKKHDADFVYQEIKIPPNQINWANSTTTIKTDLQTEAVEIRLTRQSCQQPKCPVFGRLWLDNFVLK